MKNDFSVDGQTACIHLNSGYYALIDTTDLTIIAPYRWHCAVGGNKRYVRSGTGHRTPISMHRLLLGNPVGLVIDHINGDGCDNRRSNIRAVPNVVNLHNRGPSKTNTSGYSGVHFDRGKWRAMIRLGGRRVNLGRFTEAKEAARAYDLAVMQNRDRLAFTNFPREEYEARTTSFPIQPAEAVACLGQS
jgi:hypothetical protein